MVEAVSSLVTLSDATAQLVERAAGSIVFLHTVAAAGTQAEFIGDLALSSQPKKSWNLTKTCS
jgi:hypothetical protein